MSNPRRQSTDFVWAKLGECLDCRRKALLGAMMAWILAGLIAAFGDWRQLLAAVELGAGGLTILWLTHHLVFAVKTKILRETTTTKSSSSPRSLR